MKPKFVRFHLADAEDRIVDDGVMAALGSAVKFIPDDLEKLRGRRIRAFPDVDAAGHNAASESDNQSQRWRLRRKFLI